jgi:hypothetical protein
MVQWPLGVALAEWEGGPVAIVGAVGRHWASPLWMGGGAGHCARGEAGDGRHCAVMVAIGESVGS